jgi:hypothetical protein
LEEVDRELARWIFRAGYMRGCAIVPSEGDDKEILEALSSQTVQSLCTEYRAALLAGVEDSSPDIQEQRRRARRNAELLRDAPLPRIAVEGLTDGYGSSWR